MLTSNLSTLLFELLKLFDTFFNLATSNLPTSDFKLTFLANFYVSSPAAFFKSAFVAWLDKSNSTFTLPSEDFGSGKYSIFYIMPFFFYSAIKRTIVAFPLNIYFITFSFYYFCNSKLFLIWFLQLLFVWRSPNLFSVKITNNIYPRYSVFNFFNQKDFFRPTWIVTFLQKYIYILLF